MRAVIFANGALAHPDAARNLIREGDWLIAADGGTRHCRTLGLTPHVVVGDFDSLSAEVRAEFEDAGVRLVAHPTRKDETDLELAVRLAVSEGAEDIVVLAGLGGRWDQTLANLLLLALPDLDTARLRLVDGEQQIFLIRGRAEIEGRPGDIVSLIPVGGEARGVTTEGLEYALSNGRLPFGATLGVSNVLIGESATVTVKEGSVLCIVVRQGHISPLPAAPSPPARRRGRRPERSAVQAHRRST